MVDKKGFTSSADFFANPLSQHTHTPNRGPEAREGSPAVAFPPPLAFKKSFSRHGFGQNFPLFSRVMRVWLFTASCAKRPGSVLSRLIFSGPDDWAISVFGF